MLVGFLRLFGLASYAAGSYRPRAFPAADLTNSEASARGEGTLSRGRRPPPGAFGLSGDFFARAAPLRPRPQVRGGCSGLQDPLAESNGDQGQSTPEQARRRFGRRGRARLERALTSGNGWGGVDSNHRPADYESANKEAIYQQERA